MEPAEANAGIGGHATWTSTWSAYMLEYLASLVVNGTKTSSTFKMVHYNGCAKALQEKFGIVRTGEQVKNHLKTWQKKFRKICDLRGLSAANWDEDTCTITLDDEHYNNHIKVWMLSTFTCSHNMSILLAGIIVLTYHSCWPHVHNSSC